MLAIKTSRKRCSNEMPFWESMNVNRGQNKSRCAIKVKLKQRCGETSFLCLDVLNSLTPQMVLFSSERQRQKIHRGSSELDNEDQDQEPQEEGGGTQFFGLDGVDVDMFFVLKFVETFSSSGI